MLKRLPSSSVKRSETSSPLSRKLSTSTAGVFPSSVQLRHRTQRSSPRERGAELERVSLPLGKVYTVTEGEGPVSVTAARSPRPSPSASQQRKREQGAVSSTAPPQPSRL